MKVLIAVMLALGSVSAKSGPYLPSGWRPQGPAFYLPGEVEKPAPVPKDVIVQETETSTVAGLTEYGLPNQDVSQILNQGLPDETTEQTFFVQNAALLDVTKAQIEAATEIQLEATTEAADEAIATTEDEATTTTASEATTTTEGEVDTIVADEAAVTTEGEATTTTASEATTISEGEVDTIVADEAAVTTEGEATVTEEKLEQIVLEEEKTLEQVTSIAESLINLEQDIKSEQVYAEATDELGTESVPEGFLEYGPPGFKEYGPPKAEPLGVAPLQVTFENNEVRRRRFSPKLRLQKQRYH